MGKQHRSWIEHVDSTSFENQVQMHYEPNKLGIPIGVEFEWKDFIRPGPIRAMALITNLDRQSTAITDGCNDPNQGFTVTENDNKDYPCREVNVSHLV